MELADHSPFKTLRAFGLLVQCFLAALAAMALAQLVPGLSSRTMTDPATFALFYAGVGIVLVVRIRGAKLDVARLFGPPPTRSTLRLAIVAPALGVLSIAGFWLLFLPISYAAPAFVQRWAFDNTAALAPPTVPEWAGQFCIAVLVAPVVEETLFRGLLMQRWSRRWGTATGVVLSSALFAVGHVELLGHFVFGVVMCALYLRTKSLVVPMAAHSLNNFLASAFTLPAVIAPDVAGRDMTLASFQADWWVGLLVLAAGILLLEVYRRRFWSDVNLRELFRGPVPYS